MEQQVIIRCKNNKKNLKVSIGSTLSEIFSQLGLEMEYGPVSAKVNNKVEGMHYRVYKHIRVALLVRRSHVVEQPGKSDVTRQQGERTQDGMS